VFVEADGSATAGMVLWKHDDSVIFAAYRYLFHCSEALKAEMHAIIIGMGLAIQYSGMPIIMQSDSAMELSILSGNSLDHSAYGVYSSKNS
jgi:hypothetical protein